MATNEQRSFILYIDFYDKIRFLNDQQKANLLDAIFAFFGVCECPELDQVTQIVLVDIYRCLEMNREKWLARPLGRGPGGTLAARTQGSERPLER